MDQGDHNSKSPAHNFFDASNIFSHPLFGAPPTSSSSPYAHLAHMPGAFAVLGHHPAFSPTAQFGGLGSLSDTLRSHSASAVAAAFSQSLTPTTAGAGWWRSASEHARRLAGMGSEFFAGSLGASVPAAAFFQLPDGKTGESGLNGAFPGLFQPFHSTSFSSPAKSSRVSKSSGNASTNASGRSTSSSETISSQNGTSTKNKKKEIAHTTLVPSTPSNNSNSSATTTSSGTSTTINKVNANQDKQKSDDVSTGDSDSQLEMSSDDDDLSSGEDSLSESTEDEDSQKNVELQQLQARQAELLKKQHEIKQKKLSSPNSSSKPLALTSTSTSTSRPISLFTSGTVPLPSFPTTTSSSVSSKSKNRSLKQEVDKERLRLQLEAELKLQQLQHKMAKKIAQQEKESKSQLELQQLQQQPHDLSKNKTQPSKISQVPIKDVNSGCTSAIPVAPLNLSLNFSGSTALDKSHQQLVAKFRTLHEDTSEDEESSEESSDSESDTENELETSTEASDSEEDISEEGSSDVDDSDEKNKSIKRPGDTDQDSPSPSKKRRLIIDEREARIPLEHGWRRQTKIRGIGHNGVHGEVIYYAPCSKKLKTCSEVSRYLEKNSITDISRDNFSFSPKLNVGEFLELKNPEDPDIETSYVEITLEEVLARIAQVQARRTKRGLLDKQKLKRKLQRQELAKQSAEAKIRKKIEQQAHERKRQKERLRLLRQQEKAQRQEQLRLEKEMRAQQLIEERELKRQHAVMLKNQTELGQAPSQKTHHSLLLAMELERRKHMLVMFNLERERRRQHMMLVRALEARKKQEEKERQKEERKTEKRVNKERRLEQKRLELLIAREMKKPVDDMELRDSKPLPTLNRIPGVKLAGRAFADILMIFEFLHNFGDSLGLDGDSLPTLNTLQLALLNDPDSEQELLSVLRHLLSFALGDPGVPACSEAITILNQNISQLDVDNDSITEVLRLFILSRNGFEDEMSTILIDKPFQALNSSQKANIMSFLCNELLCSKAICTQIDDNIEEMSNLRKEKWVVEGKLRKLRTIQAKKFDRSSIIKSESFAGGNDEDSSISATNHSINLNSSITSNRGDDDEDSGNESETSLATGHLSEPEDEDSDASITQEELEKKIEKCIKQQNQMRNKLFNGSHCLRAMAFGQDRYKRRYWVLPYAGGIFVEGMESAELPEELQLLEDNDSNQVNRTDECKKEYDSLGSIGSPNENNEPKNVGTQPELGNLFLQKTEKCAKFSELIDNKHEKIDSQDVRTNLRVGEGLSSVKEVNGGFLDVDGFLGKSSEAAALSSFGFSTGPVTAEQLLKNLSDTPNQKPWFSILPRMPCDETSITRLHISPNKNSLLPRYRPLPFSAFHLHNTAFANVHVNQLNGSPTHFLNNMVSPHPFSQNGLPFGLPSPVFLASTPLSTPVHSSQDAFSDSLHPEPQPVPIEYRYGWWRITDPNQLKALTKNFQPRGIRERNLQKNLQRHMEFACQACTQGHLEATDLEITDKDREISQNSRCAPEPDSPDLWFPDVAFRVEMALLRSVEELEERLVSSSMQVKNCKGQRKITTDENIRLIPRPCETDEVKERKDNEYYPVELTKERLMILERSIERRYLKAPLIKSNNSHINISNTIASDSPLEKSDEVPPVLRLWREMVSKVDTSGQLALCLNMLESSIAWDKSIMKAFCQFCRNGDNEAMLLLCDGCDKGYHTYCFKPKMENIPEGDWFCYECIAKATGEELCVVCGKKHNKMVQCEDCPRKFHLDCLEPPLSKMPRGKWRCSNCVQKPSRSKANRSKKAKEKEVTTEESQEEIKPDGTGSPEKADRVTKQQLSKDLLPCRTILAELEKHEDAWPFLLPVNTKQFPTYRRVIKQPMDFSSMRNKLRDLLYQSPAEFAADARNVFNNCEIFNEDNSAVGRAGHSMRKFFNKRWAELLGEDE